MSWRETGRAAPVASPVPVGAPSGADSAGTAIVPDAVDDSRAARSEDRDAAWIRFRRMQRRGHSRIGSGPDCEKTVRGN